MKKTIFLSVILIAVQNLYGEDLQMTNPAAEQPGIVVPNEELVSGLEPPPRISDTETDFLFAPEYNRAFKFCWDVSALGRIKLNGLHNIKAGIAMGAVGTVFEMKAFAGGEAALPIGIPLFIGLSYNYNGLEEYDHHIHSLPLLVSFQGKRLSAALGVNFRFVSFLGEPPLFEPILTASLYVAIIDTDFLRLGLKVANFNDFTYDNLGAYFLNLNTVIYLNENLSLLNELELHQSGSIALASNFYGLVYRGGVTISW